MKYLLKTSAILICFMSVWNVNAQEGFPVPEANDKQLFYLQRTSNKNTIIYEINKKNNVLDTDNPVKPFWIRYEEDGSKQELSYIQRQFAYGVKSKKIKEGHYRISLTAYTKYQMDLIRDADGEYRVYANANGKKIQLKRIFIKITGGSTFSPDIEYFELKGIDQQEQIEVAERMKVLSNDTGAR